jgi:hypothetical protein|eukprot:CAMPEP_0174285662 /NCGR_PEP_ID=MMETSP0809-20121228/9296_1 /TAXON_ID=73025 ORGANISM="Eutreptiella gymnastica-like, Strain CCMP1594" /NCGR_SAMPLE_ID=MMETSP0809 /ASSEMBLY_ACC=CAM_ASM_000658 /LENGTH=531 /DNA_ID=CAMNT_0015381487 /DNA_START=16 /DNA_END=1611 /DNA_ORIENTATION=+
MKLIVLFLAVLLQLSAADTLTSLDKAIQVLTGTQNSNGAKFAPQSTGCPAFDAALAWKPEGAPPTEACGPTAGRILIKLRDCQNSATLESPDCQEYEALAMGFCESTCAHKYRAAVAPDGPCGGDIFPAEFVLSMLCHKSPNGKNCGASAMMLWVGPRKNANGDLEGETWSRQCADLDAEVGCCANVIQTSAGRFLSQDMSENCQLQRDECPFPPPPPDSKDGCAADVMLVMDGSSSILNFDKVKQYMKVRAAETTGQQTPIGNRMGVVVFSGSAEITCPLDWDKARLLACIDKIEQPGGATRTPLGILLAHKHLLDQPNGPHNVDVGLTVGPFDGPYPMPASMQTAERKPVIEIVTDGQAQAFVTDPLTFIPTMTGLANEAKTAAELAHADGIVVLAIGVGPELAGHEDELWDMASHPKTDHAGFIEEFDSLAVVAAAMARSCPPTVPPEIQLKSSPSPSPSPDDCILEGGKEITFYCPYESILMEHCYKCYEGPGHEVIVCDGWSEPDIRAQCESPTPIASPSPLGEES